MDHNPLGWYRPDLIDTNSSSSENSDRMLSRARPLCDCAFWWNWEIASQDTPWFINLHSKFLGRNLILVLILMALYVLSYVRRMVLVIVLCDVLSRRSISRCEVPGFRPIDLRILSASLGSLGPAFLSLPCFLSMLLVSLNRLITLHTKLIDNFSFFCNFRI